MSNALQKSFVHREPTRNELELFRLSLSTFQDGSGQLKVKSGTLPGWRDFERTVGEVTNGMGTEDKSIFDVLVPGVTATQLHIGLSCKMRKELSRVDRDGRVTIELSNSSKKMWEALGESHLTARSYKRHATKVGKTLVNLITRWHSAAAIHRTYRVNINKSYYLSLQWDLGTGKYQLFSFPLQLPDPDSLNWYFTDSSKGHLNGDDQNGGRVFEWYGESGGQLKYYPLSSEALWKTPVFALEPVPASVSASLAVKAAAYFPELWNSALS